MELARARFLSSPAASAALAALPADAAALAPHRLAARLRKELPAAEASAVAEQVVLRAKARERAGVLPLALYTAPGLEMMTHPLVAARRAARLAAAGLPVLDLTCGIGGDLAAVAATGARAAGLERDPATAVIAAANLGGRAAVVRGDARRPPFAVGAATVLVDPSRRDGGGRTWDPAAFSPPWDVALALAAEARLGVVKAPPGISHERLPADAETEFVQLGRSLREAAVWRGAGVRRGLRRAVLLPAGEELDSAAPEAPAAPRPPAHCLFDPESCVTRAGVVRQLAQRLGALLLDPQVAYLSAPEPAFDPLCATFEVLEALPFSAARLKARLRESGRVPTEIRRRAFPIEPDELRRLLGRLEGEPVTLLCTTIAGRRTVFVARRLQPPST